MHSVVFFFHVRIMYKWFGHGQFLLNIVYLVFNTYVLYNYASDLGFVWYGLLSY